jgi:hypothetical protein|tara:strand:+ start:56 stop:382 length:327 start_codon:yes stop_codon:yes gene_type:complete
MEDMDLDVKNAIAALKGLPTREELMTKLTEETLIVTFLKLDGDRRVMTCTLHEGVVPPATKADPLSQKKVRAVSDKVCSVWDINAKGWRSFRYDRIEKIDKLQGELNA